MIYLKNIFFEIVPSSLAELERGFEELGPTGAIFRSNSGGKLMALKLEAPWEHFEGLESR